MSDKNNFHFTGICGTAMGAVAAAMKERGYKISGSDSAVYPPISTFLESRGIKLERGYRASNIPEKADIIVVGNAISRGNEELEEVLNRKLRYVSMPEVLKDHFLRGKRNYVVSGTHGKTTTTSLLTWVLHESGKDPGYLIGGLPRNFDGGAAVHHHFDTARHRPCSGFGVFDAKLHPYRRQVRESGKCLIDHRPRLF